VGAARMMVLSVERVRRARVVMENFISTERYVSKGRSTIRR
jgi:hypothetical protein